MDEGGKDLTKVAGSPVEKAENIGRESAICVGKTSVCLCVLCVCVWIRWVEQGVCVFSKNLF